VPVFVDAELAIEHVEGRGDRLVRISDKRVLYALDSAVVFGRLQPRPMALFCVRGHANNGGVPTLKFCELFLKRMKFGGAHEREIFRVEKEDDVLFSMELIEGKIGNEFTAIDDGGSGEMRSFFANKYGHEM
jgi:hypothetical protein